MIFAPLEMLLVNLFVIHKCSQRKFRSSLTYISMGLFVCALLYMILIMSRNAPGFGDGSGLFIIGGCLFFIPVKLIYKVTGTRVITIACFSWAYTFLLFAVSVRIGYALTVPGWPLSAEVLIVQTVLYALTIKAFYGMLKSRFVYILDNIGNKELTAFMWVSIIWFWTVFIINLSFVFPDFRTFQILTFFTLAICIIISYRYIFLQVKSGKTIQNLEKIAFHDELTQLRSRVVLNRDAEDLISRGIPFHLIFFDLDDFKTINDRYSHQMGDRYLAFFAYEIKSRVGNQGGFYRIAGDEFISILLVDDIGAFLDSLNTLPDMLPETHVSFLGFSYGIASFPRDGETPEELLHCADQRMYAMKSANKSAKRSVAISSQYYGAG